MYEQRDNSGSLFVNDRKAQPNHPDRTGSIRIDGVDYWLNGWLKKKPNGEPYLSLSVKPKEQPQPVAQHTASGNSYAVARGVPQPQDDLNDEIPF